MVRTSKRKWKWKSVKKVWHSQLQTLQQQDNPYESNKPSKTSDDGEGVTQ